MAAMLKHTHSADILFGEEEPRQTFPHNDSFYSTCSSSARNPHHRETRYSQAAQPWPPLSGQQAVVKSNRSSGQAEKSRPAPIAQSYSASELSPNSQLFADDTDYTNLPHKTSMYKDDNANYKSSKGSSGDLYSKSWCGDTFANGLSGTKSHREIKEYRPCVSDTEGAGGAKQQQQTGKQQQQPPQHKYSGSKYHNSIPTVPPPSYNASLHSHSTDHFYMPSTAYNNDILARSHRTPATQPPLSTSTTQLTAGTTDTVEDVYTVPHTFDHHRVTRQPQAPAPPPQTPNTKPPPTLTFPPPPPPAVAMGDRRRTWSPPAFSRLMENGGHLAHMRSYRSNEQLEEVVFEVTEEEESVGEAAPPKLTPVSGRLQQNAHQSLIKPIAFKPVVLPVQPHYGTTSRCPTSPRQPVSGGHQQRSPPQSHQLSSESQDNSPQQPHGSDSSCQQPLEKMRAKTLSPYELRSNTLSNGVSYMSPPHGHHGSHQASPPRPQATPQVILYDRKQAGHSHLDDGYISQDCHSGSHSHSNSSHSNTSHGSLHNDSDRSFEQTPSNNNNTTSTPGSAASTRPGEERSASFTSTGGRGVVASAPSAGCGQTPSPSDSGVGELEAMLRDKDALIQHLRDTMERNETAILQVCAEKEQNWDLELQQAHADWEAKWRQHQQKAFKMEQALLLQLFKLQQERKALRIDTEKTKNEWEETQAKYSECLHDLKQTKVKLDEVNWDLCQKSGEISLLKSQLKDSKDETVTKKNEVITTKSQLKTYQKTSDQKDHEILTLEAELKRVREDLANTQGSVVSLQKDLDAARKDAFNAQQRADLKELQLDMKSKELERAHIDHSKQVQALKSSSPLVKQASSPLSAASPHTEQSEHSGEAARLRAELAQVKAESDKSKAEFTKERDQWLEEKNKVIRYQKHLQLNYVQMYRKNKVLESEVEQLTLDLEKKDLSLMDSQDGGQKRSEGEESMC